jgi:hypothetical protein
MATINVIIPPLLSAFSTCLRLVNAKFTGLSIGGERRPQGLGAKIYRPYLSIEAAQ